MIRTTTAIFTASILILSLAMYPTFQSAAAESVDGSLVLSGTMESLPEPRNWTRIASNSNSITT